MAWAAVVVSICTLNFIWAVVVVKWSACLPSTTTIWVRFPLKSTNFLQKMFVEKKGNRQKEAHLKKLKITFLFSQKSSCLFKLLRSSQFIVPFTLSLSLSLSLSWTSSSSKTLTFQCPSFRKIYWTNSPLYGELHLN